MVKAKAVPKPKPPMQLSAPVAQNPSSSSQPTTFPTTGQDESYEDLVGNAMTNFANWVHNVFQKVKPMLKLLSATSPMPVGKPPRMVLSLPLLRTAFYAIWFGQ